MATNLTSSFAASIESSIKREPIANAPIVDNMNVPRAIPNSNAPAISSGQSVIILPPNSIIAPLYATNFAIWSTLSNESSKFLVAIFVAPITVNINVPSAIPNPITSKKWARTYAPVAAANSKTSDDVAIMTPKFLSFSSALLSIFMSLILSVIAFNAGITDLSIHAPAIAGKPITDRVARAATVPFNPTIELSSLVISIDDLIVRSSVLSFSNFTSCLSSFTLLIIESISMLSNLFDEMIDEIAAIFEISLTKLLISILLLLRVTRDSLSSISVIVAISSFILFALISILYELIMLAES